jgi:ferritin-like metal-binding protein YciE
MAQLTAMNPISNLMYDWLTVLHEKAEGLAAYEKYIRDAEEAGSQECVEMFRKLYEQDAHMLVELRDHVFGMIRDDHEATRS